MDKDKVEVYALMTNVIAKFVLALAACGVFVLFAVALVWNPSWPLAAAEAFLTGTVYVVFKHYFG